jgi:ribosomal protein S18 acetylase RimI-like enzyme
MEFLVREKVGEDTEWLRPYLRENWGSEMIVSRGRVHDAAGLPGFVAVHHQEPSGLVLYHLEGSQCEIVLLESFVAGVGIGTTLINRVKAMAASRGCERLWLVTTNDNCPALRFYQRRGFVLAALHRDAIAASRRLKPELPLVGLDGIPIRDEIELEFNLS